MALTKAEMSEYLFDVTFRPGQKLKSRVENASPRDK